MDGKKYAEVSTSYFRRVGKSSLRPIRDTTMFFVTVFRMGLVFAPLKLFGPVAVLIFILGLVKGLLFDYRHEGTVGVLAAVILLSSLQIFMMGLLAQLIVYSRFSKNNSFYK
jgi:hypothetical protein